MWAESRKVKFTDGKAKVKYEVGRVVVDWES